jgi:hypothetical protein
MVEKDVQDLHTKSGTKKQAISNLRDNKSSRMCWDVSTYSEVSVV